MITIKMPQAKPSMLKGTIVEWIKNKGDVVKKGDVLLKVEADEGLIEIESALEGTIHNILVPQGVTVAVNTPIVEIAETGAKADAPRTEEPTQGQALSGPVTPVVMPQAGQSMEEGTIVKWMVKPGDRIKKGDAIFEVETDKATLEVEATDEGRLARIVVQEDQTVPVLEVVAYLAENDADVDAFISSQNAVAPTPAEAVAVQKPETQQAAQTQAPTPAARSGDRVKASPAARKTAQQRGVELSTLPAGSGPGGRILSTDIPATGTAASAPAAKIERPATPPIQGEVIRKRMSGMRKAIARNLSASKQTIPHFYMRLTVDADPMYRFYQTEKAKYPCSLNDVVLMGCAKAMREFSAFRSRLDNDEIVEFPTANIGIAVGMDDGLVVPVLIGADAMTLQQIGSETRRLATTARGGKIEGMGQGCFTITNLGMFGVEEFAAIINPPEAAILAVGTVREEVIVSGGTMRPGRVMTMTLSADHRIIDGLLAAKFMARLKEILEYPQQLI